MALQISTSHSHQLLKRVFTSLAVFALLFQPLVMGGFAQAVADPADSYQLNLGGNLYRDVALDDCDSLTECKVSRSNDKLENWTVKLFLEETLENWELAGTDTTDAAGNYKFASQQGAGTYHVCVDMKAGWTQSAQNWSGSGYLVNTPSAPAGDSAIGPYCTTTQYADTGDRSAKSNIGMVDTGAPSTVFLTPSNLQVTTNTNTTGTITDNHNVSQYSFSVNGPGANDWNTRKWTPNTDAVDFDLNLCESDRLNSCDESTLPDGEYKVRVAAYDGNGNRDISTNVTFILDNTLPEQVESMIIRQNGEVLGCYPVTNDRTITVDWADSTDANFSHYRYQADADKEAPYDYTTNVNASERQGTIRAEDGTYNYRVRAVDAAGNLGTWSDWCGVHLDQAPPSANAGDDQEITGSKSATLSGSSDDASASFEWELVSGPGAVTFADNQTATTAVSVDTYGTYIFKLTTKDTAGNPASDDVTVTFVQQTEEPEDNTGGDTDTEGSTNNQSDDNSQESTTEDDEQLFTTSQSFGLNSELLASTNQEGDDENEQAILSTSNQNTDENGNVLAATDEQDGCYKLFGLCWYWWIPIGVGVIGILWFLFASRSKHHDDDLPPRRQG